MEVLKMSINVDILLRGEDVSPSITRCIFRGSF